LIHLKTATLTDIPTINSLANKIWRKHYPGIITNEQIDFMLDWMYSSKSIEKQMNEGASFMIAFSGEEPVGYLSFSKVEEGEFFLHKFYVDTDQHRKGIGSEIFNAILVLMDQPKSITLTVNRKNIKAINFYFKVGFTIKSAEDFDIGNGYYMNDFVMVKKF